MENKRINDIFGLGIASKKLLSYLPAIITRLFKNYYERKDNDLQINSVKKAITVLNPHGRLKQEIKLNLGNAELVLKSEDVAFIPNNLLLLSDIEDILQKQTNLISITIARAVNELNHSQIQKSTSLDIDWSNNNKLDKFSDYDKNAYNKEYLMYIYEKAARGEIRCSPKTPEGQAFIIEMNKKEKSREFSQLKRTLQTFYKE